MTKNNLNILLTNMSKNFNDARNIYSKCSLARALNKTSNKINTYKMDKHIEKDNIINFKDYKKK